MNDIVKAAKQADSKWNAVAAWVGSNPKKSLVIVAAIVVALIWIGVAI